MFRAPSENVSWANYFSWGSKSFSNGTWRTGGVYHKFRTHKSNGWLSWSPQCSPQYNGQFGGPPQFKKYQQSSSFVIGNLYAPNVHHWSTVLCRMSRDCLWWHMWTYHNLSPAPLYNFFWLVVDLPLWKIWVRQLGSLFPIYGKQLESHKIHVPNHQPVMINHY
jgi:hypothetical protein